MCKGHPLIAFILMGGLVMTNVFDFLGGEKAEEVRKPAVSGAFYPRDPSQLSNVVDRYLADASPPPVSGSITALISPHAGYPYSAHVAAHAYALIKGKPIRRVIVISPSHVEAFHGASVYSGDAYQTPLGLIKVDKEFCGRLAALSSLIEESEKGHGTAYQGRGEHALEVQLPFLQRTLDDFQIVPVVMGDQASETCRALGLAMAKLADGSETLIIASSDLSHYHSYDEAVRLDRKVIVAIERWDYMSLLYNLSNRTWEACGGGPIVAAMIASEEMGANKAKILKYANSGDVPPGDKSHVVGYVAVALYRPNESTGLELPELEISEENQRKLLQISRDSIASAVTGGSSSPVSPSSDPELDQDAAVFVTLRKHGDLRGCVGSIVAKEPLAEAVATAAANAALNDHRFVPVEEDELDDLDYEISVLSPFRRITDVSLVKIGRHGLLLEKGNHRGLLLPQVATEHGWDSVTFLEHTCLKAGLPAAAWKDHNTDIYVFSAYVFGTGDPPVAHP